jgi:diacylglycerol kinase family enzyme
MFHASCETAYFRRGVKVMGIEPDYAVLLNSNARRVSDDVCDEISELIDPVHVFMSDNEREAAVAIERILDLGYGTVFTAGGDGTVHKFINSVKDLDDIPRIGVLGLGTGNALAEIVSSGDPISDLGNYIANRSADTYSLPLCECEGTTFAFGGVGIDAHVLNDFFRFNQRLEGTPAHKLFHNVGGYIAATLSMTIPRMLGHWLQGKKIACKVTNVGGPAHAIKNSGRHGGSVVAEYASGATLYEGPANTAIFGTCPFYGYRMKMLPYAGVDPTRFHLRISNVPTAKLVANARSLWNGTIADLQLWDFQVDAVKLEFSEPMPFQLAGDAAGTRTELTVRMGGQAIDLVRFI